MGGGSSSALILTVTDDGAQYTLNKTFGEIAEAFRSGTYIIVVNEISNQEEIDIGVVTFVSCSSTNRRVYVSEPGSNAGNIAYVADDSDNAYPYYFYAD